MSNIYEYDPSIDLSKHIIWQYNNAPAINYLINQKQEWFNTNQTKFWNDWVKNVLNIQTANDYGLSIWGILLNVPRTFDVEGERIILDTNRYRKLILARLRLIKMRGTVPEINSLLKFLFGEYGKAYVVDNLDMTMTYFFDFNLSKLQIAILQTVDLLPRPAGVKITNTALTNDTFGFNGSDLYPFDQKPFAQYLDF